MAENPTSNVDNQQQEPKLFDGIDPAKLDPQSADAYKNMQADYTRKMQELAEQRKAIESERGKYNQYGDIEKKFQEQSKTLEALSKERQVWQSWAPVLQKINNKEFLTKIQNDPNFVEKIISGGQSQQPQTGEQTVARIIDGLSDDDYLTAGQANKALFQLVEKMRGEILQQAVEQFNSRGTEAIRTLAQWMSDTLGNYDKISTLRLARQYGLNPLENAPYDTAKILEYMQQNGVSDPELAYELAYGRTNHEQALQKQKAEWEAQKQKDIEAAAKKAREEAILEMTNRTPASAGFNFGHLPQMKPQSPNPNPADRVLGRVSSIANGKPGYGNVEKEVDQIIARAFAANR